jgi:putative ATP-dependent endonuclease of the OLD family
LNIINLNIQNFRSISSCDLNLQNFSILIGRNNTGKSNLLHAIKTLFDATKASITDEDFYGNENHRENEFSIQATLAPISKYLLLIDEKNRARVNECVFEDSIQIRRICGRNPINPGKLEIWNPSNKEFSTPTGIDAALKPIIPEIVYFEAFRDPSGEATGKSSAVLGKILKLILQPITDEISEEITKSLQNAYAKLNIIENSEKRDQDRRAISIKNIERIIQENVRNILPEADIRLFFRLMEIEDLLGEATIKMFDQGVWTSIDHKGQGNQRLLYFSLIQALADQSRKSSILNQKIQKPYVLLIEEPEAFLYPSLQERIGDSLEELSDFGQVIIASHSPSIVKPSRIQNTIIVKKINNTNGLGTSCFRNPDSVQIDPENKQIIKILALSNSSDFLFSDQVLVVEGISDKTIFESILKKTKKNPNSIISIIDCGSKDHIHNWCNFLNQIGFPAKSIVDIDFIWRGAGKILENSSEYSRFLHLFWEKAASLDIIDSSHPEKSVNKSKISDAVKLLQSEFNEEQLSIIRKLKEKGIWVLHDGELESYVGLSNRSKGDYSVAARNILNDSISLNMEFEEIIQWVYDN